MAENNHTYVCVIAAGRVSFFEMENCLGLNTWLTQKAMARILGVSQQNISAHARAILSKNKAYKEVFVRTMKPEGRLKRKSRKYYHSVFLEMIASRMKRTASEENMGKIEKSKTELGRMSFKFCLITD